MKKIILFLLFFVGGFAQACSFTPDADIFKTAQENYSRYEHVVVGTFVNNKEKGQEPGIENEYTLDVQHVFKGGISTGERTIVSPGHSCGFFGPTTGYMLWLTNDVNSISEGTPKYFFQTKQQAIDAGNQATEPVGSNQQTAPDGCKVWYDGCNTCVRNNPGEPWGCTKMACFQQQPSQCRSYFTESQLGGNEDIESESTSTAIVVEEEIVADWGIQAGWLLRSNQEIQGNTPNDGHWNAFEGQVGHAELRDSDGVLLDESPMTVEGDWMHASPHDFSLIFYFVPTTTGGVITLFNDNTSGEGEDITIEIPVVFDPEALPHSNGPFDPPGDDFREPTSPPPTQEPVIEEKPEPIRTWWQRIWDWIIGLFS